MDIYVLDLNKFDKKLLDNVISEKEISDELTKQEHLAGRYILNFFAEKNNIKNQIFYKNNKPYFQNNEYFFSISHCDNIVAVVFAKHNIGFDIENNKKERDFLKLLNRFNKENLQDYANKNKETLRKEFYEFWTKYEAQYKLQTSSKSIEFQTGIILDNFNYAIASEQEIENLKWIFVD